jgi:hypothetical protein
MTPVLKRPPIIPGVRIDVRIRCDTVTHRHVDRFMRKCRAAMVVPRGRFRVATAVLWI